MFKSHELGFAFLMLGKKSSKHILPNGGMMVIYHGKIRKQVGPKKKQMAIVKATLLSSKKGLDNLTINVIVTCKACSKGNIENQYPPMN